MINVQSFWNVIFIFSIAGLGYQYFRLSSLFLKDNSNTAVRIGKLSEPSFPKEISLIEDLDSILEKEEKLSENCPIITCPEGSSLTSAAKSKQVESSTKTPKSDADPSLLKNNYYSTLRSTESPKVSDVCYHDPNSPNNRIGRPFLLDTSSQKLLNNYLSSTPLPINRKRKIVPQLVTAFSANHFHEHQVIIPSAFEFYPGQKILIYDIGLSKQQADYIRSKPEKYIYKLYNFQNYPKHVKLFTNMVFKITIWIECLLEFKACQWFDTSINFIKNSSVPINKYALEKDTDFIYRRASLEFSRFRQVLYNLSEQVRQKARQVQTGSIAYLVLRLLARLFIYYIHPAGHNIAWATHPEMFSYFPSDVSKFNEDVKKGGRGMSMAGAVIIYDTERCRNGILKWAYMCALTKECISPTTGLSSPKLWHGIMTVDNHFCNGTAPRQKPFNCHRYDQSLLSILVNNFYGYETSRFHIDRSEWIAHSKRVG